MANHWFTTGFQQLLGGRWQRHAMGGTDVIQASVTQQVAPSTVTLRASLPQGRAQVTVHHVPPRRLDVEIFRERDLSDRPPRPWPGRPWEQDDPIP